MMADNSLAIDAGKTALVVIDLQRGVAGRATAPHTTDTVIANCACLAERFRSLGALVVLVRVSFSGDGLDRLNLPADAPGWGTAPPPSGWDKIVPEIGPREGDLVITKRQWGAFYGTSLDLQLRRRGINTIVLGGIATNFGVESTARDAYELGYTQILVEDAMASMTAELHAFPIDYVFPRLGLVRSTAQVLTALDDAG
jgi:nicotinamidase-related amidase